MTEIPLRVVKEGPFSPGDVYYNDHFGDWVIVLPIPGTTNRDIHFALNTPAYPDCPHNRRDRHRCWEITGDEGLANGDTSKLTLRPSILVEYDPGKSIHGYVTDGKWIDC